MSGSGSSDAKRRVLVTRRLPDAVEARLRRDYESAFSTDDKPVGADDLVARAAGMDAVLPCPSERFSAELIGRLPDSVRIVACYSVGVDHVDLEAATARGLVVTNTPGVLTDATAEIAILLMLGAARRASEGEATIRKGAFPPFAPTHMLGTQLTGKRLGILGMGAIGRAVAKIARALGMEIHYHNRSRLSAELEAGATFHAALQDLLAVSDVLSINCPATRETHHLIDAERIARLPDGAILVNTARGAIVEDEAVIAALRSGKLTAAGLDVFEGEPDIHPGYKDLPNTFLLPHLGSGTLATREAMGFRACDNLDAFFAGEQPPDRVA